MQEIFDTFDALFKKLHEQGGRLEELEQKVYGLEKRLQERESASTRTALRVVEPHEPERKVS
jgi:hypothetical protein